ncbi:hypothetical protein GCM10025867_48700 (plasmid) [Frondihabitans sucicola]|uniref:NfeD-like C-terminal domain-containing protein n=1 Tax=Frondihabitans sucicola TaxID=1268041 RepID=A0ABN6Y6C4_9MICO|nr:NfeD family protein [Frondihabitans sucicola]BDZ52629.1 hypothetical protein GCM10025867_48700 [Frondihabitans sucicola]
MLPFIIVGGVGLGLLLVSIIIGDILDIFDIGEGLVSGVALGTAMSIFGLAGVITDANGLPQWATWVIAIAGAALTVVIVQAFVRSVTKRESGGYHSPVGFTGRAMSPIEPTFGEVTLDDVRELARRQAYSDTPIPRGARIRVVSESGHRVLVEPIDDPQA